MTTAEIAEIREIMALWGAKFAAEPSTDFINWLTRHGCSEKDSAVLACLLPEEGFTLRTKSFTLSNVFGISEAMRESSGQTTCTLKLIEDGLLAVSDCYAPVYNLIDLAAPFTGPTHLVEYYYFQAQPCYDPAEKIERWEYESREDGWFESLRHLRHDPERAISFFVPRSYPEDRKRLSSQLSEITG